MVEKKYGSLGAKTYIRTKNRRDDPTGALHTAAAEVAKTRNRGTSGKVGSRETSRTLKTPTQGALAVAGRIGERRKKRKAVENYRAEQSWRGGFR